MSKIRSYGNGHACKAMCLLRTLYRELANAIVIVIETLKCFVNIICFTNFNHTLDVFMCFRAIEIEDQTSLRVLSNSSCALLDYFLQENLFTYLLVFFSFNFTGSRYLPYGTPTRLGNGMNFAILLT